jgi:hypothetical protein
MGSKGKGEEEKEKGLTVVEDAEEAVLGIGFGVGKHKHHQCPEGLFITLAHHPPVVHTVHTIIITFSLVR